MSRPARAPSRGDAVLAAATSAITLGLLALVPALASATAEVTAETPGAASWQWWVMVVAVLAQGVVLAYIARGPARALVVVSVLALACALPPVGDLATVPFVPAAIAAYVATRRRRLGESWTPWLVAAGVLAVAGWVANARLGEPPLISIVAAVGQAVVVIGIPTGVAAAVGVRAQVRQSREREILALASEQEARMEAALAAERTAIARELHDIAAHHLSGIALMSSAISQQIDTDPATAKAGLADVRAQTRTLLDELRALVALLRQDDGAAVDVESLDGLEGLVGALAARGVEVRLTVADGHTIRSLARGIGPLGQFAAYRTVQEALANSARHAPGTPCTVELRDADDALEICVTNGAGRGAAAPGASDGTGQRGGFGLRGMEERAALTRAALTYGPLDDGGWHVRLVMPREKGLTEGTA